MPNGFRKGTLALSIAVSALPVALAAQTGALSAADSALIGRVLLAEDGRDSTDGALAEALRHADSRVRIIAQRAHGRIRDPRFAARDSLPAPRAPVAWPEPSWRLRYRALTAQRSDCAAIRSALTDSAWPVRLHAIDLVSAECSTDDSLARVLRRWVDALPADASRRPRGSVSWHAAAHALVALARVQPREAGTRIRRLAAHRRWEVRAYAARAAAVLSDTATLRALARDRSDNVKEVAIESLAKLTGHADDGIFLSALGAGGAQAVRAAALALKGSPRPDVARAANATFERWVARANASERDVRVALLEVAGRPASDDRPPPARVELPPEAVALALGADRRLRVTMAPSSGGGSFVVRLRGDVAPMMAARILALARAGYYDGLTWHRVEHDFVVQGGSPGANEYVGLAQYLRDELGTAPHARGTVGMSTRGHDTGDAQWFINLKDNLRLNRDYTVFAEVIEGIDVVDGILEGDVMASVRAVPAWRDPFPHRTRLIGSPENRIHVLDWGGRGPAVVLLPGFSLTAHAYDEIATALSTQFRVIAVTPLGVGESDAPENRAYTIESMADDLKMVLDSLRISRASLVGHSISGSVAAAFAIKHPRRVSRIVFLDAYPYFFAERGDSVHARNTVPPPTMVGDTTYEDIARYLARYWFRPWTRALEADLRAKSLGPDNARREALTTQYIESNRTRPPDVRALSVPSLQLCAIPSVGSEFAWLRPDSSRYETARRFVSEDLRPFARRLCSRFARTVPRGRVREIAGSHYLFFTRPAETARHIRSFLEPAR